MKRWWLEALILSLLSGGAGFAAWKWHPRAPALFIVNESVAEGEISVPNALALAKKDGILWDDARVKAEYDREHVPGAVLLNMEAFEDQMFELMNVFSANSKPIVVYCDAQKCSQSHAVAERLRGLGNGDVRVLRGGWPAWKQAAGR